MWNLLYEKLRKFIPDFIPLYMSNSKAVIWCDDVEERLGYLAWCMKASQAPTLMYFNCFDDIQKTIQKYKEIFSEDVPTKHIMKTYDEGQIILEENRDVLILNGWHELPCHFREALYKHLSNKPFSTIYCFSRTPKGTVYENIELRTKVRKFKEFMYFKNDKEDVVNFLCENRFNFDVPFEKLYYDFITDTDCTFITN